MPTLAKLNGTSPSDRDHDGLNPPAFARRRDLRLILIIAVEQLNARAQTARTNDRGATLPGSSASPLPIEFRLSERPGRPNCRSGQFQPIVEPIAYVSAVNALFFPSVFRED